MTDIVKISDHVERSLARTLTQYKAKEKFEGLATELGDQSQELEDAIHALVDGRAIATATGEQLDQIGTIVDQERGGFDDDFYRILLYVKIGQNTSQGGPEKIINIFKLLTEADLVHYQNLTYASAMLGTDQDIAEDFVDFVYESMEKVAAGGVRIDHIVCFDPDEPFSFDGPNTGAPGLGFSDITGTTGGKFAKLHRRQIRFAFDGNDIDAGGFGSLLDPIVGGTFVGIGGS